MPDVFDEVANERKDSTKGSPTPAREALSGSPDVFDEVARERGLPPSNIPGMEKLGGMPPQPTTPKDILTRDPRTEGLRGPAPTFGQKVLQNLPLSLAQVPEHLTRNTPGAPMGMETLPKNESGQYVYRTDPVGDIKNFVLGARRVLGNPMETFASDPAGVATDVASGLAGFGRFGGFRGITEGVRAGAKPVPIGFGRFAGFKLPASIRDAALGGLAGEEIGRPFGVGPVTGKIGVAVGAAAPMVKAGAKELHFPSLIRIPSEEPRLLGPARSNMPGAADTSGVTVTTGEPLSYPGPRLLGAPAQEQAPVLGERRIPDVSVNHGGFAAGPQIQFVEPSPTLRANPRALDLSEQLRGVLARASSNGLEAR